MKNPLSTLIVALFLFICTEPSIAQTPKWQYLGPDSLPAMGGDGSHFLGFTRGIGRTTCIRFNPFYDGISNSTVYVGTPHAGLWRSYNGTDHWQEMNTSQLPNTGIGDVVFDPHDTAHLYVAIGDPDSGLDPNQAALGTEDTQSSGIYESRNGGISWSDKPTGTWYNKEKQPVADFWDFPSKKVMRRIFIHPTHPEVMVAVIYTYNYGVQKYEGFVYRSADKGQNWVVVFSYIGDLFRDFEIMPGNPDVMYVSGLNLYKSDDAGLTWRRITSETFPADSIIQRCKISTCASDPNILYALMEIPWKGRLYISKDAGATFSLVGESTGSPSWRTCMAADPDDQCSVFYSSGNVVSRFYNNRSRWLNSSTGDIHNDIHEIAFAPGGKKLYVSTDAGLYISDNPGVSVTWKFISNGIGNAQVWRIGTSAKNPDHLIAGLQDCGTLLYNSTSNWEIVRGGDGMSCFIDYTNDSVMYHNDGQNNIFARSDNCGKQWTYISPAGQSGDYVKPALMDPVDHNAVYVGFHNIYKSTDSGKTWSVISNFSPFGKPENEKVNCIAVAPSNHKVIYTSYSQPTWSDKMAGKIFRSTDGGDNWQDITNGLDAIQWFSINALAVDPNNADAVYVGFRGAGDHKIMRSLTGGTNSDWQNYSEDLPKEADVDAIAFDKRTKGEIYIGTHQGVYERKKSYSGWIPFMDGEQLPFPHVRVTDLQINYTSSELFAATLGRGVWKTVLPLKGKKKKVK